MRVKKILGILLLLNAGLLSCQVVANTKYPASDFQPKIIYQSDEAQLKTQVTPLKAQDANVPATTLLVVVLLFGCLGYFICKNGDQKNTTKNKISLAKTTNTSDASKKKIAKLKRINKNYKGYRSPRFG